MLHVTRSRYTPCGYKRYVQQIILELIRITENLQQMPKELQQKCQKCYQKNL